MFYVRSKRLPAPPFRPKQRCLSRLASGDGQSFSSEEATTPATRWKIPFFGQGDDIHRPYSQILKDRHGHGKLPLTPVHHEEIGKIFPRGETSAEDLIHHGVIVSAGNGTDAETSIAAPPGNTAGKGRHGTHGVSAADIGDIEAFDPFR